MQLLRGQRFTVGCTVLSSLAPQQWIQLGALQLLLQQRLSFLHTQDSCSSQSLQHTGDSNHAAAMQDLHQQHVSFPAQEQQLQQPVQPKWHESIIADHASLHAQQSWWTAKAGRSHESSRSSRSWSVGQQHAPHASKHAPHHHHHRQQQQQKRPLPAQQHRRSQQQGVTASHANHSPVVQYLQAAKRAKGAGAADKSVMLLQQALSELLSNMEDTSLDTVTILLYHLNKAGVALQPAQLQPIVQHLADHASACSLRHIHAAALAVSATQDRRSRQLLQPLAERELQLRLAHLRTIEQQQKQLEKKPKQTPKQHQAALSPWEVRHALWLYEVAAQVAVPKEQMQQLLLHVAATVSKYTQEALTRVVFHARQSGLPAHTVPPVLLDRICSLPLQQLAEATPADVSRILHAFEYSGRVMPQQQLQQLVDCVLANMASCQGKHAVRVLRSAGFSGLQLPQDHLHALLELLTFKEQADMQLQQVSLIILAMRAVSHMGQQIEQAQLERLVQCVLDAADPKQGLPPKQASSILKAVTCMGQTLPEQQLQPLLKPLQQEAIHRHSSLQHLATLLLALKSSRDSAPSCQQQLQHLLDKALAALQREATAENSLRGDSAPSCIQNQRGQSSSSANSMCKQSTDQHRMSAASIAELLRALNVHDAALPAQQVEPLTAAFISKHPTAREIAMYVASVGGMYLAPSRSQMTAMIQQVQQQLIQLTAGDVGMLLWGLANTYYSLQPDLLRLLLQQLLQQAKLPSAYQLAQSLWAVANMGSSSSMQTQHHGIPADLMQQLLQKLYQAILQERRLHSSSSSSRCSSSRSNSNSNRSSGGSSSKGEEQPATMDWHISVAAWAVAVCDARSCEQEVLKLCGLLANPAVWQALRLSELVQLSWAHLWLCNYVWSDTGGLAACLSQEQLQHIKSVRRSQVACVAVGGSALQSAPPQEKQQRGEGSEASSPGWVQAANSSSTSGTHMEPILSQCQMLPVLPRVQRRKELAVTGPSASQALLYRVVRSLPNIATATLESVTPDGLFSVDIEARTTEGHLLAVEFDGPYHYATNVPVGAGSSTGEGAPYAVAGVLKSPGATQLAGQLLMQCQPKTEPQEVKQLVRKHTTWFRDRALAAYGYTVVSVPFYEWAERGPLPDQQQKMQLLIQEALGGNSRC